MQPWALKNWHGRWYLTGYDLDRSDDRAFRLSRFEGAVRKQGRAGSYSVPEGHEPQVALQRQVPEPEGRRSCGCATAAATRCASTPLRPALDDRWDEVEVPYWRGSTERDVAALGRNAVAVSPPELVDAVRSA